MSNSPLQVGAYLKVELADHQARIRRLEDMRVTTDAVPIMLKLGDDWVPWHKVLRFKLSTGEEYDDALAYGSPLSW